MEINQTIFTPSNNYLVTFLASFLIWLMFFGLVLVWFRDKTKNKKLIIKAVLVSVVAWSLANMLKEIFPAVRPFRINGFPIMTLTNPLGGSFPSAHAAASFALAVAIWLEDKKLGSIYILAAILVSLGRILSNVHYPIDVAGGAIIGTFVALAGDGVHNLKISRNKRATRR
jgi:undecaprenyl-diphosphatase